MRTTDCPQPRRAARKRTPGVRLATALWLAGLYGGSAAAEDPWGLYVGAELGQPRIVASGSQAFPGYTVARQPAGIDLNPIAYQLTLGARPVPLVGGELAYIDFTRQHGYLYGRPVTGSLSGVAAFGVLYVPVSRVELYVKAGVARLDNTVSHGSAPARTCTCLAQLPLSRTDTRGAAGVGAQFTTGAWAIRAEYERFDVVGATPSLFAVGVTWSFH